jgi:hypothetical protein
MRGFGKLLVAALPAALFTSDAAAVRAPDGLAERAVEPAVGRGRKHAPIDWTAPRRMHAAWSKFRAQHGAWSAQWDHDRDAPSRVWGEGIAAPGANADAAKAETAARGLLAEQLALLAPGTAIDDWSLVTNVTHGDAGDMRTVAFVQRHAGLEVMGGQLSFLFKRDRMILMSSEALPDVKVGRVGRLAADVITQAQAWIEDAYGARPSVLAVGEVAILPLVRERDDGQPSIEYRTVRTVVMDLALPRARAGTCTSTPRAARRSRAGRRSCSAPARCASTRRCGIRPAAACRTRRRSPR